MKESSWFDSSYYTEGIKTRGYRPADPYTWENRQPHSVSNVRDLVAYCRPFNSILDAGCALGFTVRALVDAGFDARGVDFSEWAVANADTSVRDRIQVANIANIPYADKSFDMVCSFDVLEHLDKNTALNALREMLRVSAGDVFVELGVITEKQYAENPNPEAYAKLTGDQSHSFYITERMWEQMMADIGGFCITTTRSRDLNIPCETISMVYRRIDDRSGRGPGWLSKRPI